MQPVCPFGLDNVLGIAMILLVIWSAVWKGIALWMAGRRNHLVWFIVMFILNTAGILEIIYIFAVARKQKIT